MGVLPSLNFGFVKNVLWEVGKDLFNEAAFDQIVTMYSSICTKFAAEYIDGGDTPKTLKRFRKKFYKIGRITCVLMDEIDAALGKPGNNADKFEELFKKKKGRRDTASTVIEIKSKRRRSSTQDDGDSEEDD